MKLTSDVPGVCWVPSHNIWLARDIHKKTLCRGKDKIACESARLEYDKLREEVKEERKPTKTYKHKERFRSVFQPCWPATTGFPVRQ